MLSKSQPDLIYDLGMHHGLDTDFYLKKGFRVVALEANPDLCARGRERFAEAIADGRLEIVEAALSETDHGTLSFFVNPVKDDWSSAQKSWAEKGGHSSIEITVQAVTLHSLFRDHGVPYYIKCDIEGADLLFTEQLRASGELPDYVSVEAIAPGLLQHLKEAGYQRFALVNQALNWSLPAPNPPLEGNFAEVTFNGHMSGLFGREIDQTKWVDYEECLSRYNMFVTLIRKDDRLVTGWLDFHAAR